MKTVVGLFESERDVREALDNLHQLGVRDDAISVVMRDTQQTAERSVGDRDADRHADSTEVAGMAAGGASVGGVMGLIAGLGALGSLAIPGIGPVIAVGTLGGALASILVGAGVGAGVGGLIGALTSSGVPEHHAHVYSEGVRRGGTLVSATVDDLAAEQVSAAMRSAGAVDVDRRRGEWESQGWTGFDPNAEAYDVTDRTRR